MSGTPQLTIWSATEEFRDGREEGILAGLFDCTTAGTSCTLLATGVETRDPWPAFWEEITIDFGAVSHTITSGRALVLKLVVTGNSDRNVMLAYDTTTYLARFDLN